MSAPPPPRPDPVTASPALSLSLHKGSGLKQRRCMATRYEKTALASGLLGTLVVDAVAARATGLSSSAPARCCGGR
jgi:hypothetical protein